jgi:hypothetical protein
MSLPEELSRPLRALLCFVIPGKFQELLVELDKV